MSIDYTVRDILDKMDQNEDGKIKIVEILKTIIDNMEKIDSAISAAEEVKTLKGQVSTIQTKVAEIDTIKSTAEAAQAKANEVDGKVTALDSRVAALESPAA